MKKFKGPPVIKNPKNIDKHLDGALRKCFHHDGRIWCGYITPIEMVSISEALGGWPKRSLWQKNYVLNEIKNGQCKSSWFYFDLP